MLYKSKMERPGYLEEKFRECRNALIEEGYTGPDLDFAIRPFNLARNGNFYGLVEGTAKAAERRTGKRYSDELWYKLEELYSEGIKQKGPENAEYWHKEAFRFAEKGYGRNRSIIYAHRAQKIAEEAGINFSVEWEKLEDKLKGRNS